MVQRSGEEGGHIEQIGEYVEVLFTCDRLHISSEYQIEIVVQVMFICALLFIKAIQIKAEQPGVQPDDGYVEQKLFVCVLFEEIIL